MSIPNVAGVYRAQYGAWWWDPEAKLLKNLF